MKMRYFASAALLGVLALIVSACGGGADPTAVPTAVPTATPRPTAVPTATAMMEKPDATATPAPAATRPPVPTATPTVVPTATPAGPTVKRGGTISFSMPTDPATLEVTKVETYTVYFNMDEIWSNLVQYKSDFYTQVEFIGDLADRWEVNEAGDKYTFFLNPNARLAEPTTSERQEADLRRRQMELRALLGYGLREPDAQPGCRDRHHRHPR